MAGLTRWGGVVGQGFNGFLCWEAVWIGRQFGMQSQIVNGHSE